MSWSKRWPFRAMELAFLTKPVAGLTTPGMPMPTVAAMPRRDSHSRTKRGDGVHGVGIAGRSGDAVAEDLGTGRGEDGDLDLGAAEVDADSVLGHEVAVYQRAWDCSQFWRGVGWRTDRLVRVGLIVMGSPQRHRGTEKLLKYCVFWLVTKRFLVALWGRTGGVSRWHRWMGPLPRLPCPNTG